MVLKKEFKAARLVITGVILVLNFDLSAQPGGMTLAECLEKAKTNYPFIKSKRAQAIAEEERLRSSKTEYLPSLLVGGQVNYGTNNSIPGAFYPNEGMSIGIS